MISTNFSLTEFLKNVFRRRLIQNLWDYIYMIYPYHAPLGLPTNNDRQSVILMIGAGD